MKRLSNYIQQRRMIRSLELDVRRSLVTQAWEQLEQQGKDSRPTISEYAELLVERAKNQQLTQSLGDITRAWNVERENGKTATGLRTENSKLSKENARLKAELKDLHDDLGVNDRNYEIRSQKEIPETSIGRELGPEWAYYNL